MVKINEREVDYRFGDSGPKYLMRGPKIDFGLVKLKPGEDFPAHYHNEVEESFYILEGEIHFNVAGNEFDAKKGDLVSCAPGESHYLINNSKSDAIAAFVKSPSIKDDKVNI